MMQVYVCWYVDEEEEPDTGSKRNHQEACDPEWAAQDYVERTDHGRDYAAMEDDGVVVAVRSPDGGLTHWRVCGVRSVDYTANPCTVEDMA